MTKVGDRENRYYGTWTALQTHMRTEHPPTCLHEGCNNKVFASHHNLRAHLRLHEEREVEDGLDADVEDEAEDRPKKRRRGGDLGRDWKCSAQGCDKDFKSVCPPFFPPFHLLIYLRFRRKKPSTPIIMLPISGNAIIFAHTSIVIVRLRINIYFSDISVKYIPPAKGMRLQKRARRGMPNEKRKNWCRGWISTLSQEKHIIHSLLRV